MYNYYPFGDLPDEKFINQNFNYLNYKIDKLFLRNICYKRCEFTKMISFLVRDENWKNYEPDIIDSKITKNLNECLLEYNLKFSDENQKMKLKNTYTIKDNHISLKSNGKFLTNFKTNRIGFNLLLPLEGLSGRKIIVQKFNNELFNSYFPEIISPDQPFIKFKKIQFIINNHLSVKIFFKGIDFEMEDQRNWGDQSYKIYSGSLTDPFPYIEKINSNFFQQIDIFFDEIKEMTNYPINTKNVIETHKGKFSFAPSVGVKINDEDTLQYNPSLSFNYFYYIYDIVDNIESIQKINFQNKDIFLVILVDHLLSVHEQFAIINKSIKNISINIKYLLIVPKIYLNSFQPSGEWPNVPDLDDYYFEAKKNFPKAKIVGGMVTNFTEFNRKKPPIDNIDLFSCSFSPIVHDASNHGIFETPLTLPHLLKTFNAINSDKDIHLGPISLGMHFNPYGESLVKNTNNLRIEMTDNDMRHDSLLSLVWSIGAYENLLTEKVKYLTFYSLTGYHGIFEIDGHKRPLYYFNEVILHFANKKMLHVKKNNNFFSLCCVDNNKIKYFVANKTNFKQKINLKKNKSYKGSYLNELNFYLINQGNFSFLNTNNIDCRLNFLPYEVKYIETTV